MPVLLKIVMSKLDLFSFPVVLISMALLILTSIGGVFLYKKIAINFGIIANPNFRSLHELPVPRGGGVMFSLLFTFFMVILWVFKGLSDQLFYLVGVGGLLAAIFGLIDDIKNISARFKLVVQFLLAVWAVYLLFTEISHLWNWLPLCIVIGTCLFFMVWVMNAYNFMDGVDGMAASGAIFSTLTLAVVLYLTGGSIVLISILIFIAITVSGFLVFNWAPATVFMGDSGSVFLGYFFGSFFLLTVLKNDLSIWNWLTIFGYFFADTSATQVTRIILVKKWYLAHRSHAYQNLARLTKSHAKVSGTVVLYNLLWVLPLATWSALQPQMGVVTALLSVSPALYVSLKFGPILSSS